MIRVSWILMPGYRTEPTGDWQCEALQERKVHMDVQALGLEAGEAVGDGLEPLADGVEMIQSFLQAEVAQVVGAEFIAQKAGELLVLLEEPACFQYALKT
jgi:hypothetical protein